MKKECSRRIIASAFAILLFFISLTGNASAGSPQRIATGYTIRYVDKDKGDVAPESSGLGYVGQVITVSAISVKGYSLVTASPQTITLVSDSESNVIVYVYDYTKYSISYDLNGGSVREDNPTRYTIDSDTFTLNNPVRAGYSFTGWTGTGLSANTKSVTIKTGSTGNREYTANWSAPVTYEISYSLNGGTLSGNNPATYNVESKDIRLINPKKTGYKFTGWSGTGIKGKSVKVTIHKGSTGDRTYKANWSDAINYKITYELNGGTVNGNNPETYNIESSDIKLINPKKIGYKFAGWSGTGIKDESLSVTIEKGSTGNRTYTANWTINNYTVTFNAGTNGTALGQTTFEGLHYGDDTPDAPDIKAHEGWVFKGWSPVPELKVTEDATYTAQYAVMAYSVRFVDYDGKVLSEQTVNYGEGATAPPDPKRDGYAFSGWDKPFDFIKSDTTITAQYDKITAGESDESGKSGKPGKPGAPGTSSSPVTTIGEEQSPLTNGIRFDWAWLLLLIPLLFIIWLLLYIWFSVIPIAEKVFNNGDGTFTVQWGYLNRKHRPYIVDREKSVVYAIKGEIISSSDIPVEFSVGRVNNAFTTTVEEDAAVAWKINSRKAKIDIARYYL